MHERRQGPSWLRRKVVSPDTRRQARHATHAVLCSIGEVQDLSPTGMRARASGGRPPVSVGQVVPFTLRFERKTLTIPGRVVRVAKTSRASFDIGVEFVGVTDAAAAALEAVARYGFVPSGFRPEKDAGEATASSAGAPRGASRAPASEAPNEPRASAPGDRRASDARARALAQLPNYYEMLGVPPDAAGDQIQHAFRALARRIHPDVCKEPGAEERFAEAHRAYEILRDHDARRVYDEALAARAAA